MFKFDKWYMPDGEEHLPDNMTKTNKRVDGRLSYQYTKYEEALKHVVNRRLAVDVGAHIGLWSYYMARDFKDVACFEPMQEHRACWRENMQERLNADLFPYALSDRQCFVKIETRTNGSSGDTGVVPFVFGDTEAKPLDYFNFPNVDLLKIDTEGYEMAVIKGAVKTIERCWPVIVVEQKYDMAEKYGFKKLEVVSFLEEFGYEVKNLISGDYILKKQEKFLGVD